MLNEILHLPGFMRFGALVFALGAALDLIYHASPADLALRLQPYLGANGDRVHLVIMVGMFLIVLGLLRQGLALGTRKLPERLRKEASEQVYRNVYE